MHDEPIGAAPTVVLLRLLCVATVFAASFFPALAAGSREPAAGQVRGIVRAQAEPTISSELVAVIRALPFEAGEAFKVGEVIVAFDCRRYRADLEAAEAEIHANEVTVAANESLRRHKALGENELMISRAKLRQARAAAEALRVKTDQCVIKAPFDGRVVAREIEPYELSKPNAPLIKIVADGELEIDLIVPSDWLVWLAAGAQFDFEIDETGTRHAARVSRIGAVVDPISRTAKVMAKLLDPHAAVRPGMSGTASFKVPKG